jgi:hypothetical protein
MTSRGSITLPRLFDIFRPYLSRTMACKYTDEVEIEGCMERASMRYITKMENGKEVKVP